MTFYFEILVCLFLVLLVIGIFFITPDDQQRTIVITIKKIKTKDKNELGK